MIQLSFNMEDISQIVVGSAALAIPVSFSEEAWDIGASLPVTNLLIVFFLSVAFLSFFAYQSIFQANIKYRVAVFIARIFFAYTIALLVVALILFSLNKFPLFSEPLLAIKRLIVVGMPASMGAIIVDGFDKE
jgi:uncharacterized membrane protein